MKVTVDKLDPDFTPLYQYVEKITLDGKVLKGCISADEEKGEVLCYEYDEQGEVRTTGEYINCRRLFGKVEIHFKLFQIIPSEAFIKPSSNKRIN